MKKTFKTSLLAGLILASSITTILRPYEQKITISPEGNKYTQITLDSADLLALGTGALTAIHVLGSISALIKKQSTTGKITQETILIAPWCTLLATAIAYLKWKEKQPQSS